MVIHVRNSMNLVGAILFLPFLAGADFAAFPSAQSPHHQWCGVRPGHTERIVNGHDAPDGKWPWLAHIVMESRFDPGMITVCTGSIVSSRYILTAAHCLLHADRVMVTVGSADIDDWARSVRIFAKAAYIHPNFLGVRGTARDDIALIELSHNLTFSPHIQPICLPSKFNEATPPKQQAVITGWGRTLKPEKLTTILQEGQVELLPYAKCRSQYRHVTTMAYTKHLCAVGRHSDVDRGDSGGPLVVKMRDEEKVERYYQVGITSFGMATDDVEVPNVYTRLSNYCAWITKVTKGEVTCS